MTLVLFSFCLLVGAMLSSWSDGPCCDSEHMHDAPDSDGSRG